MSQKYSEKKIGRFTYRVRKLDPWKGADLVHDLMTTFTPAAGGALGALMSKGVSLEKIVDDGVSSGESKNIGTQLQSSIEGIFKSLTKSKQKEWIESMRDSTLYVTEDGNEPELKHSFDEHFRGNLKEMYQWLYFALMSQFDDFLDGPGDVMSSVARLAKNLGLKSQSISDATPIVGN